MSSSSVSQTQQPSQQTTNMSWLQQILKILRLLILIAIIAGIGYGIYELVRYFQSIFSQNNNSSSNSQAEGYDTGTDCSSTALVNISDVNVNTPFEVNNCQFQLQPNGNVNAYVYRQNVSQPLMSADNLNSFGIGPGSTSSSTTQGSPTQLEVIIYSNTSSSNVYTVTITNLGCYQNITCSNVSTQNTVPQPCTLLINLPNSVTKQVTLQPFSLGASYTPTLITL